MNADEKVSVVVGYQRFGGPLCPHVQGEASKLTNGNQLIKFPTLNKLEITDTFFRKDCTRTCEGVSISFRAESITKYTLTTINTR
jgi:hypothetical protein